ncbi:hypothetical protein AgCh_006534 [Apium graveolens]
MPGDVKVKKKLHEPLERKKQDSMDEKAWNLLDRQAMGVVRRNSGELSGSFLNARSRGEKFRKGKNKGRSRAKSKKRGQSKNHKDIVCWNCQKKGHFRNQCTAPVAPKGKGKKDNSTNVVEEVNFGKVHLSNDETLDITGMGDINLRTSLEISWILKDVRYIHGLKKMFLSVGQLDKEGYRVTFGDGQWKVITGNLVIARGEKKGTLYIVEQSSYEANAVADEIESSTLWHQRLVHMSEKGMKLLTLNRKIPKLKNLEVGFYEPCVLRKQIHVTFT